MSENFITSNAYVCIEINALYLVELIKIFRNKKIPELFIPTLFSSQPCEETFRQMRSMSTINYTKINFTLLELIHLIGRVKLQNDIIHSKLANVKVFFPRDRMNKARLNEFPLPSDVEIQNTIQLVKSEALHEAKKFGMIVSVEKIEYCNLTEIQAKPINETDMVSGDDCDDVTNMPECLNLKDYSSQQKCLDESSKFIEIKNNRGVSKVVRKSSLVWTLSNLKGALSALSGWLYELRYKEKVNNQNRNKIYVLFPYIIFPRIMI